MVVARGPALAPAPERERSTLGSTCGPVRDRGEGRLGAPLRRPCQGDERPDFAPSLRGPWGKFREYAGRLALILTLVDHAANPLADALAVPDVCPRQVENAWKLIAYFKSHARRVHESISLGSGVGGGSTVKTIVEWIRFHSRLSFKERDVAQDRRWIAPDKLAAALNHLAQVNAIRPQTLPTHETPKPGRPCVSVLRRESSPTRYSKYSKYQNPPGMGTAAQSFEDSES